MRPSADFGKWGLVISNVLENLSIQTGFPFGHYHYTGGGKIFQVPWFIGPAYLATGYLAWVVATVLLDDVRRNSHRLTTIGTPLIQPAGRGCQLSVGWSGASCFRSAETDRHSRWLAVARASKKESRYRMSASSVSR